MGLTLEYIFNPRIKKRKAQSASRCQAAMEEHLTSMPPTEWTKKFRRYVEGGMGVLSSEAAIKSIHDGVKTHRHDIVCKFEKLPGNYLGTMVPV